MIARALYLPALLLLQHPPSLSLAEALAHADQVAEVAVARAEARARERELASERLPAAPTVSIGTTRYSARESLHLSQEIRWAGQRRFDLLAAGGRAEAAAAEVERERRAARREIRLAWFDLAGAEDAAELAREISLRAAELSRATAEREAAGKLPRLDTVRARAEEARLAAQTAAAGQTEAEAWSRLGLLLALPLEPRGHTDGGRPAPLALDRLEHLLAPERLADHPALRAAAARLAAAEAAVWADQRRRLPGLTVEVGVDAGDPGLPGPDPSAVVGLNLPLRGRTTWEAALAERDAEAARLEALRRDLRSQVESAYRRALGARARLEAYDTAAMPAAAEAAQLTREAFVAGRGDLARVLEADRAWLETRSARLDAYLEVMRAEADLRYAAGENDASD